MDNGCLKTELSCPAHWKGHLECMLPHLRRKELLYLDINVRKEGRIEGVFEVQQCIPMLTSKGPSQRMQIAPYTDVA